MNVLELKEAIEKLPNGMLVGGRGHFGEYLEIYDGGVETVSNSYSDITENTIFCITMQDAGEEPD